MTRFLLLLLLTPVLLVAQPSVDLQQAFLDLTNDGVLMCVSAHPDDEDGATLSYYRMKYGAKTYSVFLTRGEGGQNEKGPELYEDLGVLRTAETEAAGKIQGAEVFFLNFMDFGYSKSATEAFQKWGRNEVLRRLVYIIRKLKPDVIFTNLNTIDGHGHHQATAIATIAAFDAAADSTFAPEQLQLPGITLWQPKKFFIRNINRPELGLGSWGPNDVVNNVAEVDKARGIEYLDIATNALRMHKTQGMERADLRRFTRGQSLYKLFRSNSIYDRDTTTFFGGIDLWNDPSLKPLVPLRQTLATLRPGMPLDSLLMIASSSLNQIRSLPRGGINAPLAARMLSHWQEEVERLVQLSCNITFALTLADPVVVPSQRVNAAMELRSPDCRIGDVKYEFSVPSSWVVSEAAQTAPVLDRNHYLREFTLAVGESPVLTLPEAVAQYRPIETNQNVSASVHCSVAGHPFAFSTKAAFDVAPPQTFTVVPKIIRIAPSKLTKRTTFEFTIQNFRPGEAAGKVAVQGPRGWNAEFPKYRIETEDSVARGSIIVTPAKDTKEGEYLLRFKTEYAVQEVVARVFDVAIARDINVGIIKSYDNTLEGAVKELGIPYRLLDENDLEGNLTKYKTIVIDIRAYLVREDLKKQSSRLLQYVKDGGNLIVMYQRPQEWKPEYAPYPFELSSRRVTVEEAPIDILKPSHPLLTRPNLIADQDWSGWKQERAVYFPSNVPKEYEQLLSSHDPDEPPLTTGYLVASYGKGSYIYTSYVWYRQLKEMNQGAFRCFANMISYPPTRE
ncbi:MAG: hypothetical protein HW412_1683 [Bacteroidetes bacterium]|nr:hypothetical protein [Bacteroidota bacterium]